MINQNHVESLYDCLDNSATLIYKTYKTPYLEGLIKTCENIISNSIEEEYVDVKDKLQENINKIVNTKFDKEEIRKSFQYACLKGFKHANISNQMITPETIGIFINYLINKLYNKKKLEILDPITGTSNLLTCVANNINKKVNIIGVEKNMLSYKLSLALFDMLGYGDKVYFQDTLTFNLPEVDLIIGDFSGIEENETYSIIKHSGINISEGGFLIGIFDDEVINEDVLIKHSKALNDIWNLFGLIKLPQQILKSQNKSIVIFQKNGKLVMKTKRFLLVELPEFSNKDGIKKVINLIDHWFKKTEFYKLGEK